MKKLIIIICLLWSTITYAVEKYELFGMNMPMMCGTPETIDQYIKDKKFTPVNLSFGKENAKPEGTPIFLLTYYINDKEETLAVAESPNDPLRCVVFHTFNMKMNPNLLGTGT